MNIYVRLWEVVAYGWWSHMQVQLYLIKRKFYYYKERFVAWKVRTKVGEILNSFKPSKLCPPLFKRHSKELNIPADHRLPGKIWKTDKLTRSFILVSYSNWTILRREIWKQFIDLIQSNSQFPAVPPFCGQSWIWPPGFGFGVETSPATQGWLNFFCACRACKLDNHCNLCCLSLNILKWSEKFN